MAVTINGTSGVNTPAITGMTTPLPASEGGTGITAVGISGNVLTSNGTAWTSATPASSGGFTNMVVLTSTNASYSIPATKIKVTVVGGGGAGGAATTSGSGGSGGGGGASGIAVKILSGLTISNTLNITIGASAGNTTVASGTQTITTITGAAGSTGTAYSGGSDYVNAGGAGGIGSNGDLNIRGGPGLSGSRTTQSGACPGFTVFSGVGGSNAFGGGGIATNGGVGVAGTGYGGGGSGACYDGTNRAGGAGAAGVVIVEY